MNPYGQEIIKLTREHVYIFLAIFCISFAIHLTSMIFISVRQKHLIDSSVGVPNIKMFSPFISERLRHIIFLFNIFDYGSKDGLFKLYVLMWRISGFVLLLCFVVFLIGDQ